MKKKIVNVGFKEIEKKNRSNVQQGRAVRQRVSKVKQGDSETAKVHMLP